MTRDERVAIQTLSQESCEKYEVGNPCLYCEHEFSQSDTSIEQALLLEVIDKCLPKPCDDAISRDAVLDIICRETEWYDIRTQIEQLPSVTQKSGKWIYRRGDKYSCSKCGTTTSVDEAGIDEKPMYKFCPYCGRRMESEDNEE